MQLRKTGLPIAFGAQRTRYWREECQIEHFGMSVNVTNGLLRPSRQRIKRAARLRCGLQDALDRKGEGGAVETKVRQGLASSYAAFRPYR